MKSYCEHCDAEQCTVVEQRTETYPVKGENTTILSDIRVCAVCKNPVWDSQLDGESLKMAFDSYREKHGLLTCAQIKTIRQAYGLSQTEFAKLLGLGEKTIARYETGSIQDEAINTLMWLASVPSNMRMLKERKLRNFQEDQARIPADISYVPGTPRYTLCDEFGGATDVYGKELQHAV